MIFFFFCFSASFTQMQLEHYVLAKASGTKTFLQPWMPLFPSPHGCSFPFPLPPSPRCCHLAAALDFLRRYLSMRWWWWGAAAGKACPPRHMHTQSHMQQKHNGWLEDLMGFQSSVKSLDDGGWGGCSAGIWLTSCWSVCTQRGREQSTVPWQPH